MSFEVMVALADVNEIILGWPRETHQAIQDVLEILEGQSKEETPN